MRIRNFKVLGISAVVVAIFGLLTVVLPTQAVQETFATVVVKVRYLTKTGKLPAKYVTYDNQNSGLRGKDVQAALDEVGISLAEVITKGKANVRASSNKTSQATSTLPSSVWKGYYYSAVGPSEIATKHFSKSEEITVTFSPTSSTTGTYTTTPRHAFNPVLYNMHGGPNPGDPLTVACDPQSSAFTYAGTFEGTYQLVEDRMFFINTNSDHAQCKVSFTSGAIVPDIKGKVMTFIPAYHGDFQFVVLTRQ